VHWLGNASFFPSVLLCFLSWSWFLFSLGSLSVKLWICFLRALFFFSLFAQVPLLSSSSMTLVLRLCICSSVFVLVFRSSSLCFFLFRFVLCLSVFSPALPCFVLLFFRCLCSAFYRARELAKTSPCYSPTFTGLLINPRSGSWAKDVVHEWIELLQFSLLNRLSPREIKGIVNSSSKRRRLCPWE